MKKTINDIAQEHFGQEITITGNGPNLVKMGGPVEYFHRYLAMVRDRENGIIKDPNDYPVPPAQVKRLTGHSSKLWTVNGGWSYHPESTVGFMMDNHVAHSDASHPQAAWYDSLIRNTKIPIITSQAYPDYPAMVEFPLKEVVKLFKTNYFGETIDYMCALAGYFKVKKVNFIGCDYQIQDRYPSERAGTEYWIGRLEGIGIEVNAAPSQNLMKVAPRDPFFHPMWYGYAFNSEVANDPELMEIINSK